MVGVKLLLLVLALTMSYNAKVSASGRNDQGQDGEVVNPPPPCDHTWVLDTVANPVCYRRSNVKMVVVQCSKRGCSHKEDKRYDDLPQSVQFLCPTWFQNS
jgi:hypothetical protein